MGNIKKRQKRKYLQIWYYPCGYFYPVPVLKILQPPDLCGKSFDTVLQAAIWQLLLSTVKKCQNLSTLPRLFLMPSKYASRSNTFLKKKKSLYWKNSCWMSDKVAVHVQNFIQAVLNFIQFYEGWYSSIYIIIGVF